MNQADPLVFAGFAVAFALLWLLVTTLLDLLSGWFRLMREFPDRVEQPKLRLRYQSGMMGQLVGMNGILALSVCPSGIRIGIMRLFGPFSRNFFVPWNDLVVVRKKFLFWPVAKLQFGNPMEGSLTISAHVADRLARAAAGHWPEAGPFKQERRSETFRRLFTQWAALTCFAALFFTLAPVIMAPGGQGPPIVVAILFPAIVFGIGFAVKYFIQRD
jgi:hypothetical protein